MTIAARIPVTTLDVSRALRELRTRALRDAIRAALGRSPAIAGEGLPARAGVTSVADVRSINLNTQWSAADEPESNRLDGRRRSDRHGRGESHRAAEVAR